MTPSPTFVSAALKDASHWKHEAEEAHTVLDQYAAENTELRAALSAAVAQEKERCAKIAEEYEPLAASPGRIAEAIRKP